jgi:UDP-3-O-[3-hydroxymyristoyl] N-acetylglucosamine deacetylase
MTNHQQRTLKHSVTIKGCTLHSNVSASLTLHPAPINTGIIFRRIDINPIVEIPAKVTLVEKTFHQSNLALNDVVIGTVEHVLSALAGLGIDNAFVDVSNIETPILDGSSFPFALLILAAGIQEQDALKKFIRICETITINDGEDWASLEPYDGFKLEFSLRLNHPYFSEPIQSTTLNFSSVNYIRQVSQARTFGLKRDHDRLKSMNLAFGSNLENTVVFDEKGLMNKEGLRFKEEPAKHKILDAIGDLYLLGNSIIGCYRAIDSTHAINNKLLNALLSNKNAWYYEEFNTSEAVPISYDLTYLLGAEYKT